LMVILKSMALFVAAGLCEIGGGFLVWQWLRQGKTGWFGAAGGAILMLYGVVATYQPQNFGRVFAAYGGVFIAMSLLWGWLVDRVVPDRADIAGAIIALVGAGVIMFWPRNN
jgi:small multidrug resistance family-3 protein